VFLLGAVGATVAPSMGVLIVCRCIQGAGGAVVPLGFSIVKDEFEPARVPGAIGVLSAMTSIGAGAALALSGVVTQIFGWRVLFAIAAGIVALAWLGAFLFVPGSSRRVRARVDVRGAVLLALALALVLLSVTEADRWGWGSLRLVSGLSLAALLFGGWWWTERRVAEPMVDMAMLARRPVMLANLGAMLGTGFGMTAALLLLPQLMSVGSGVSASVAQRVHYGFHAGSTEVGLIMLSWALSGVLGAWIAARLARQRDGRWPLAIGGVLMAVGLGGIAAVHDHPWEVVLWLIPAGCGFAQAAMGAVSVVVHSVRPSETGVATGMSTVIRQVGGTAGTQLMAAILAANLIPATGIPREAAFQLTLGLCAAGAAASAICGVLVLPPGRAVSRSAGHVADAVALEEPPAAVLATD
jgi:MFS family permease